MAAADVAVWPSDGVSGNVELVVCDLPGDGSSDRLYHMWLE